MNFVKPLLRLLSNFIKLVVYINTHMESIIPSTALVHPLSYQLLLNALISPEPLVLSLA